MSWQMEFEIEPAMRHHSRPVEQKLIAVLRNFVDSRDIVAVAERTDRHIPETNPPRMVVAVDIRAAFGSLKSHQKERRSSCCEDHQRC